MGLRILFSLVLSVTFLFVNGQISENMQLEYSNNPTGYSKNDIWGYVHNGVEYGVMGTRNSIIIYDLSDCSAPTVVHTWSGLALSTWRDFKEYGNYIYAVTEASTGLLIIDKTNFAHHLHNLPSGDAFTRAHNIFIDTLHARLYSVGSNIVSGPKDHIAIYDIASNPTNPPLLKIENLKTLTPGSPTTGYVHDIYVRDNIGYACHGDDGMRIWDFNDLNNIQFLGEFSGTTGYCHSDWLSDDGRILYVAYEIGRGVPIDILDVSDPSNIVKIGDFKEPLLAPTHTDVTPHNPFVKDDYLYVSLYEDGVVVFDICDLEDPKRIAYYDTYSNTSYAGTNGCWGVYPYLPSGCIIASDYTNGLFTMRMQHEAEHAVIIENNDLYFDIVDNNFIFRDIKNETYSLSYDFFNDAFQAIPAVQSDPEVKVKNADIYFDTFGKGPIIKQDLAYVKISVGVDGDLTSTRTNSPPVNTAKVSDTGMFMSNYASGFILTDPLDKCWKVNVNDNGALAVTSVACPN